MNTKKTLEEMTVEGLKKELEFTKACLRDAEELYNFTFSKCSLHIGGQQAVAIQEEHEEKCWEYRERIKQIEEIFRTGCLRGLKRGTAGSLSSIFRPAKLNGHSVACEAILPVRFKLE